MDTAFVTNIMAPYRLPLFTSLHQRLHGGLGVVALSEAEQNRSWERWADPDFPLRVLGRRPIRLGPERFLHIHPGVREQLRAWRPGNIVVGGWNAAAYWSAAAHASRRDTPLLLWSGTHAGTSTSGAVNVARRTFVRHADGFLAYSEAAASFLVALGAPPEDVAVVGNPVDTRAVAAAAAAFVASDSGRQLAVSLRSPVIAYVGQLIERKNVGLLLRALAEVSFAGTLLVLGAGSEENSLRRAATRGGLDARFLGAVPNERVHELLGVIDGLVLPSSEEVWGLVVNEAMAAGVYTVVSSRCGAADIIRLSDAGTVVEPTEAALVVAMGEIVQRLPLAPARREEIARRAHALAGIEPTVERIAEALTKASARRKLAHP